MDLRLILALGVLAGVLLWLTSSPPPLSPSPSPSPSPSSSPSPPPPPNAGQTCSNDDDCQDVRLSCDPLYSKGAEYVYCCNPVSYNGAASAYCHVNRWGEGAPCNILSLCDDASLTCDSLYARNSHVPGCCNPVQNRGQASAVCRTGPYGETKAPKLTTARSRREA
ncbi:MAG: hypothetical protein EB084_19955 [Proteobacteria bacterium]|nr:hypothetical protein [Pseudomonadota bacterium]